MNAVVNHEKSILRSKCPKYLLIEKVVFYEIKIKQIGPNNQRDTFSFFSRFSVLRTKHQAFIHNIPKNSPLYHKIPKFPPKNYCKRMHLTLILRRQNSFKKYFQSLIDLFELKTISQFQKNFNILYNKSFSSQILYPNPPFFVLPYEPLKEYQFAIQQYPELQAKELNEDSPEFSYDKREPHGIENVKSILFVDAKNQKILKYSENLTFILFLDERLGKGAYGEVYKGCTNMNEKEIYAIKEITIPSKGSDNYRIITGTARNEIKILKSLSHENIVKYIESFENANHIYLVMEYCNDGNLETYIKNNNLAEKDAILLFKQIINGFRYLHEKDVVHRDVKPSNFLLDNNKIKISDFGFARFILNESFTESHIGTYPYMAPQILQGKPYNNMSDIWSLGITLFFMLFKRIPWVSDNPFHLDREIREKLKTNRLFETVQKQRISKHAEDLLIRMISYDENIRISWEKLFEHPLLQEQVIFGVNTKLNASIIEVKRNIHPKSEFLKKKFNKSATKLQTDVNCFPCGGELTPEKDKNEENPFLTQKERSRKPENLEHYSIVQGLESPRNNEGVIVNRKKNKSTNSAIMNKEQDPKTKKESIEDLKNFHSQYSLMMTPGKKSIHHKPNPSVDFPSINRETMEPKEGINEQDDRTNIKEEDDVFFTPFKVEENNENSNYGFFKGQTAHFDTMIEEEKTPINNENSMNTSKRNGNHGFSINNPSRQNSENSDIIYEKVSLNEKNHNNDKNIFMPVTLKKNSSSMKIDSVKEEDKEDKLSRTSSNNRTSSKPKKEVTFSNEGNGLDRITFNPESFQESQKTAYFKDRMTNQSLEASVEPPKNLYNGISINEIKVQTLYNDLPLDEIKEIELSALEKKSYTETTIKFKREDLIRKSYSLMNKKIHRRMTYERNVLLFCCNIAERLQNQEENFDLEPQNLAFFYFMLAKLSFHHLQNLRDEESLILDFGFDEKEWIIYKKSLQFKEMKKSFENDNEICGKFFRRTKKEVIEMLSEDSKQFLKISKINGNTLMDLLSGTQENLKTFREKFEWVLKKVLLEMEDNIKEMKIRMIDTVDDEEKMKEMLSLAEDLMILFGVKQHFKWEEGKELNFNKFIEDRQYMEINVLMKRITEGFNVLKAIRNKN